MLLGEVSPARERRSRRWALPGAMCVTVLFLPTACTLPASNRAANPQKTVTLCKPTCPWSDLSVPTALFNSGQLRRNIFGDLRRPRLRTVFHGQPVSAPMRPRQRPRKKLHWHWPSGNVESGRFRPSLRGPHAAHHWPTRRAQTAPHGRKPRPRSAAWIARTPAARILTNRTPRLAVLTMDVGDGDTAG